MKNKAQVESIIIFFFLIIGIFIVSIIILRITNEILTPFQTQIGNMSASAGEAVAYIHERFTTWWDYAIILLFFLNIILLLISSFLVDIHPAFVVIYLICILFLFLFGNYALLSLDKIWELVGTSTETLQTPLQQFLINHFQVIMLGVVILSGVIMYAKYKFWQGGGTMSGY